MRDILNIPNVDGASSDYPNGRIKNKNLTSGAPGTPVVEELYGDIIQFFQKLMIEAGLSPNDIPDNVTNGYQLFQAFLENVKNQQVARVLSTGSYQGGADVIDYQNGEETVTFNKLSTGNYQLYLPAGYSSIHTTIQLTTYNNNYTIRGSNWGHEDYYMISIRNLSSVAYDDQFYWTIFLAE